MAHSSVVNVNQLRQAVNDILLEYGAEIAVSAGAASQEVAKETVKQLKKSSPKNKKGSKRGYAKTWKFAYEQNRLGSFASTVYNEKNYRLTHLLENGHYARNGKWVEGIKHIEPAEQAAIAEFEKKIMGLI